MNVIDYITITCNINKNGRLQITSDYMIKYNQLQLITITNYRCKVAYYHVAWNRNHDVFHENMLPYICSFYDTGFKVLSMKINYLAPFKHKHKHEKFAHEN
jgi:hypothetical protein